MRRIRFAALAIVSFAMTFAISLFLPGTVINRAIATTLCGILSFNSTACSVALAQLGDRSVAASLPAISLPAIEQSASERSDRLVAQRSTEFDDEPTKPTPPVNPAIPAYPNQVSPKTPTRSDFDDSNPQPSQVPSNTRSTSSNQNSANIQTIRFGASSIKSLSSDTFQVEQSSSEGCTYKLLIKKKSKLIYQESLRFISPGKDICGTDSFLAKFNSQGTKVELQLDKSQGVLTVEKTSERFARATYKDSNRNIDLGEFLIENPRINNKSLSLQYLLNDNEIVKIKQDTTEVVREAVCVAGRRTAAGLATMFTVGAVLGLGLALAAPVTAAIAGGTALSLSFGAYATTAAVVGWTSYAMFGGTPPAVSDILDKIPGVNHAYEFADGLNNVVGLAGESEAAYRLNKAPGVREPGKGGFDKIAANFRDFLTENTGIPFNWCDKKPDTQLVNNPIPQAKPELNASLKQGRSYGDPHIVTFDGYRYSFQTVGEFTLVKSNDGSFEVQTRQGAVPGRQLALNTGAAMKVGNSRVAFYSKNLPDADTSTPLRVDGRPVNLNGSMQLPDGSAIFQEGNDYVVQWTTGEQVRIHKITVAGMEFMNVLPAVPDQPGRYSGILGNLDGNPENDLQTRSGKVIPTRDNSTYGALKQAISFVGSIPAPLTQIETAFFELVYRDFGNSWRISQAESLFDYAAGQSTESLSDRSFPKSFISLSSFLPPDLQKAEQICRQAGLGDDLLEGCLFDVANTGEAGFAQVAANAATNLVKNRVEQEIRNRIPLPIPVKLPF